MPKLYCSLDLRRRAKNCSIQAAGKAPTLYSRVSPKADPSTNKGAYGGKDGQGIFTYKYVPRVAEGDVGSRARNICTSRRRGQDHKSNVKESISQFQRRCRLTYLTEGAAHSPSCISLFAEILAYEFVNAKVAQGVGVPDGRSAPKID
jgi:hypothetical protein